LLNDIRKEDIMNPGKWISRWRCHIAGGFFSGDVENLTWLCAQVYERITHFLRTEKRMGLEDAYLALIFADHRDRFTFYYGDFCTILSNYRYVREFRFEYMRKLQHFTSKKDLVRIQEIQDQLSATPE
jgi:hypothetical protein